MATRRPLTASGTLRFENAAGALRMLHFANTTRVSESQIPDHDGENSYTRRGTRPRPMSVVQSTFATDRFTDSFLQRPSTAPFAFVPKSPTRFSGVGFQSDKCATLGRVESIRRRTGAYKDYLSAEKKKLSDRYYDMLSSRPGCNCIQELAEPDYRVKTAVHYRHEVVSTQGSRRRSAEERYALGRAYPAGGRYSYRQ